jgi:rubrerythrin/predicted phosphodiesterase
MKTGFQKVEEKIVRRPDLRSFCVIGDPGCEGIGACSMQVYAAALQEGNADDLILVAGDLVPDGNEKYYRTAFETTNALTDRDVYILRGNHDGGAFETYFGRGDYAVLGGGTALIVLDNARRRFSDEGLALVREVLALPEVEDVFLAFHIPLPNTFIANAVSQEEFVRLKDAYAARKDKVRFFIAGHVHSRFEDIVDGILFICTGGGGAMIEDISGKIPAAEVDHHVYRFEKTADSGWKARRVDLSERPYRAEKEDSILAEQLENTVKGELFAHLRYQTFAERAEKRGYKVAAALFRALAESEYRHARSFFALLEAPGNFSETVETFIPREKFEYEHYYKTVGAYADSHGHPVSKLAYGAAADAEKIHAQLLGEAADMENFSAAGFEVCPNCGFIRRISEDGSAGSCPVCGASAKLFIAFRASA